MSSTKKYDYLIVGAGLFGATFAHLATKAGKKCLVIERRSHAGGNIYSENIRGINVHKYGAHIFHTNSKEVWDFVNSFCPFNRYTNAPVANYHGKLYNLPFNMNTFYQMWGCTTPDEASEIIRHQIQESGIKNPQNLEEQAISLVGRDIYEKLIKEYTEKQWGRKCTELPAFIIKRLPVRYTFDNNYFNSAYQGIPIGGYSRLIDGLLAGIEVRLNADYLSEKEYFASLAQKTVYTGAIDAYFGYSLGHLDWRTVSFETEEIDVQNYQGNAVVNYTSADVPYTRIIEHKHFEAENPRYNEPFTVISKEYSAEWKIGIEPYYPVNDEKNVSLYQKYADLAKGTPVIFGGRLGTYKYLDMDTFTTWEEEKK